MPHHLDETDRLFCAAVYGPAPQLNKFPPPDNVEAQQQLDHARAVDLLRQDLDTTLPDSHP